MVFIGGVAHSLVVPIANVIAVYARENGQGMAFETEIAGEEAGVDADERPGEMPDIVEDMADAAAAAKAEAPSGDEPPRRPRPSHLTVVK